MIVFKELSNLGRLGNQLFQIAATIEHARKMEVKAQFPKWEYNQYMKHPIDDTLDTSRDLLYDGYDYEFYYHNFHHYEPIKRSDTNLCIHGFFQSEKYFENSIPAVKHHFMPSDALLHKIKTEIIPKIFMDKNYPMDIVQAIHIRRDDYLEKQDYHPVLPLEYYKEAVEYISNNSVVQSCLVFSDDIDWCKENFTGNYYYFSEGNHEIYDLYLMAMCKHHVVANSSYSWWGAWLNKLFYDKTNDELEKQIVIAPRTWFGPACDYRTHDMYCEGWLKMGDRKNISSRFEGKKVKLKDGAE